MANTGGRRSVSEDGRMERAGHCAAGAARHLRGHTCMGPGKGEILARAVDRD